MNPTQTVSAAGLSGGVGQTISSSQVGSLILVILSSTFAINTVTDNAGNTYTPVSGNITGLELWICPNNVGGATSVSASLAGAGAVSMIIREYPLSGSSPLDQNPTNLTSTGTAVSSDVTGTTAQSDELIFGYAVCALGDTFTVGSGFGNLYTFAGPNKNVAIQDMTVAAISTYTSTFTLSPIGVVWIAGIATFEITSVTDTILASTPLIVNARFDPHCTA